jgi:hypothetical protein
MFKNLIENMLNLVKKITNYKSYKYNKHNKWKLKVNNCKHNIEHNITKLLACQKKITKME